MVGDNLNNKKEFGLLSLIIVIIVTAIITSLTTGVILYNNQKDKEQVLNMNDESLQEFINVYNSVLDNYYQDVNKNEMIDKAIDAMLEYLGDDYTTYLNEEETEELAEKLAGKYQGIGVELVEGNKINKVFENSPAQEGGLQVGDVIIKINDRDVTTFTAAEIASEIKKDENLTKVNITVKRIEQELTFELEKKEMSIPAVESKIIYNNGKRTGYIYISTFSNTVYSQFKKHINDLETQGIDNLIIDVRNNTGGYLKAASDIASLFLEKGKIIYSLENKKTKDVYKDETKDSKNYSVVVLINESSASASEILAATLKESYNAQLVGKKSYGKGKVQQTANLNGGMYKYTSAKWLTPNGTCIDKKGLMPDFEIGLQISEDGNTVIDTQLNKALEILGK